MKKILLTASLALMVVSSCWAQRVLLSHPRDTQGFAEVSGPSVPIYSLPSPEGADLIVYRTSNYAEAVSSGGNGIWYFIERNKMKCPIDFSVIVTDTPNKAYVKVYFTENKEEAGWVHPEKKEYFKR